MIKLDFFKLKKTDNSSEEYISRNQLILNIINETRCSLKKIIYTHSGVFILFLVVMLIETSDNNGFIHNNLALLIDLSILLAPIVFSIISALQLKDLVNNITIEKLIKIIHNARVFLRAFIISNYIILLLALYIGLYDAVISSNYDQVSSSTTYHYSILLLSGAIVTILGSIITSFIFKFLYGNHTKLFRKNHQILKDLQ